MNQTSRIPEALAIAIRDLRWCYRGPGIISGSRLVYWSWDSFFASLGACAIKDFAIVKSNLEMYIKLQNQYGAIPKRIAHPWYWLRFLGIPVIESARTQKPTFWNSYYTAPSLTQNPTFLIALHAYVQESGDMQFFRENSAACEKIVEYLKFHQGEYGLLKEGIGGGWAESVLKRGAIAFTNVCYARSLYCLSELYEAAGNDEHASRHKRHYGVIKDAINEVLWSEKDGGYYSDWYSFRRHHHFATDGNLLAILWGIADQRQVACIQAKIKELCLEDDVPIQLTYGKYSFFRIYPFLRLGGMHEYHVGFSWSWLGCIDAMVKVKLGQKTEAVQILEKIATVMVRDDTVHEIYYRGKSVRTLFYKSENPWAWGAGLFIAACRAAGVKDNSFQ